MPASEDAAVTRMRGGDPKQQAGGRDDAVVGAQNRGAQPAGAMGAVMLLVDHVAPANFPSHGARIATRKHKDKAAIITL